MLRNYIVIALRNLVKSAGLSSIKIAGLSIGICGCIIVLLLAKLELSFDRFHTKSDNIYRVYTRFTGVFEGANHAVPLAFPAAFRERATGVEAVSQIITNNYDVTIQEGGTERKFPQPNPLAFIDSSYFKVFPDHRWLVGNVSVINDPYTVVLTESKARTYFKNPDLSEIVGKRIIYRDSLETTVGGIIADPPGKTDFNFTDLISHSTIRSSWLKDDYDFEDWGSVSSTWLCMIRLADGTPPARVDELLKAMSQERDERSARPGQKTTTFTRFTLQPLSDIHFNTELGTWDSGRPGTSMSTIQGLTAIAVLLLLVAVINFVNLETAQAMRRSREVGLRKVMGGTRAALIAFFFMESFVITFIAVVLALPLAKLSMMFFSEFLPNDLSIDPADPLVWVIVLGLTVIVALLSGIYPALVLSSYQPVVALRASHTTDRSGSRFLRKILTIFQFTFSQALIAGAMIIGLQIAWMMNKDLGFNRDAVVTINAPWWEKAEKRKLLVNELVKLSAVDLVSQNSRPPVANGYNSTTIVYNNGKEEIPMNAYSNMGDTTYLRLFQLKLVAGRNIQPVDSLMEMLVNETYCRKLGISPIDMVGKDVKTGSGTVYHVVGVLKDFHHASLHKQIEAWYYIHRTNAGTISVRLAKGADLRESMEELKQAGKTVYGDTEITIRFMDEIVQKFYENERKISKLANTATGLAIFISCLGLLGLASFTAIQRTKEIGIRKVLGASVTGIVALLSREFILLVIISFVAAVPLAWYAATRWLDTFPYHIDLAVWIFLAAGAISVVVALVTVGFQAVKAAVVNPVESLRYE